MEKFSSAISDRLTQKLDKNKRHYTPEALLESGFPFFIVKRIEKHAAEEVRSELTQPQSTWIQVDSEEMDAAWDNYLDTACKHIQIPSDLIQEVVSEVVDETLRLTVQPKKELPEYFHGESVELTLEEATEKTNRLHVNRQLGLALVQYMVRKEKSQLTREQTERVIHAIDSKLVENYHPLNWAQLMRPLFELAGPKVDSGLLRLFFEDKGKNRIARKFEMMEGTVTETEMVEILSSPEMLDFEGYEDDQQKLFDEGETAVPAKPDQSEEPEPEVDSAGRDESVKREEAPAPESDQETEEEETIELKESEVLEAEEETQREKPLADLFANEEAEEPAAEQVEDTDLDQEPAVEQELPEEELPEVADDEGHPQEKDDEETEDEAADDEDEGEPLLSRFTFDESSIELEKKKREDSGTFYDELDLVKNASEVDPPFSLSDDFAEEEEAEDEFTYQNEDPFGPKEAGSPEEDAPWDSGPKENATRTERSEPTDEVPMWKSFLERDEFDSESGFQFDPQGDPSGQISSDEADLKRGVDQEEPEDENEEEFIEEPIYDLTEIEEEPGEKIEDISKWLIDDKERFVEEIFKNSELAYDQALSEIVDFDDWKRASVYLEKEVFSRNRIDIYDEAAVDFTDRLHSYFMQYKS